MSIRSTGIINLLLGYYGTLKMTWDIADTQIQTEEDPQDGTAAGRWPKIPKQIMYGQQPPIAWHQSLPPPLEMGRCCFFSIFLFCPFDSSSSSSSLSLLPFPSFLPYLSSLPSPSLAVTPFVSFCSLILIYSLYGTTILISTPYSTASRRILEFNPSASCSILRLSTASRKLHRVNYRSLPFSCPQTIGH